MLERKNKKARPVHISCYACIIMYSHVMQHVDMLCHDYHSGVWLLTARIPHPSIYRRWEPRLRPNIYLSFFFIFLFWIFVSFITIFFFTYYMYDEILPCSYI